jgi:hypothetical protein
MLCSLKELNVSLAWQFLFATPVSKLGQACNTFVLKYLGPPLKKIPQRMRRGKLAAYPFEPNRR